MRAAPRPASDGASYPRSPWHSRDRRPPAEAKRRGHQSLIIGYGADDRIMDPNGALRLYRAAVNSKRQMMAGLGHPHHAWKAGGPRADRPDTLQDWMMRELKADAES